MDYLPSKRSIKFMSKMNWDELEPYMKKIYGEEYTKKICKTVRRKLARGILHLYK